MTATQWHFPRTEFAEAIYSLLARGPLQSVSLFGPRRTGKTQFLLNDLAPFADGKGHRVVYVSLWQAVESPLATLLHEFDLALRGGSFLNRLKTAAGDLAPKFTIRTPDGSGEMEIDLEKLKGRAPESHLLLLDRYLDRLANQKKRTILLFDEFQELARGKDSGPLVAGLRTALDKRRTGLAAVFAGSSQDRLRAMFTAKEAPFFRFATPVDLPPLDESFVDHQLKASGATSKAKVDRDEALTVFERFERNPMFFQRWLTTLSLNPTMPGSDAIDLVQAQIADEFGFPKQWLQLSSTQRTAARLIADQSPQLFGRKGAERWRALTSGDSPATQTVQAAVRRLSRLGLVDKWGDDWRLADPMFEAWVRGRPKSDF